MAELFGSGQQKGSQATVSQGVASPQPEQSHVLTVTDANFEQVLEHSKVQPVVIDLWAEWCGPCKQLGPILESLAAEKSGAFMLGKVDVDQNPSLAQAFQAQSIPAVFALIGGQAMPLFVGAKPEHEVRAVIDQVLEFAANQGIVAPINAGPIDEEPEPEPEPLDENHQRAEEAIADGNFELAQQSYQLALDNNPRDEKAETGLARVGLLARLGTQDPQQIRAAAAAAPQGLDEQMQVADLDLAGGHVEDAFLRLLDLFQTTFGDDRETLRRRLVDYFALVGQTDPRTVQARGQLANMLY